jgi:hypothetical protein
MDMDTFFSETNIASLRHLALPGITATDRTELFQLLIKRFIDAQNLAKHRKLAFATAVAGRQLEFCVGRRREAPNGKPGSIAC